MSSVKKKHQRKVKRHRYKKMLRKNRHKKAKRYGK